jgi:hypothetical protein
VGFRRSDKSSDIKELVMLFKGVEMRGCNADICPQQQQAIENVISPLIGQ